MKRLDQVASYIRSKNAGPFALTIDIFFDDRASYELVRESGAMTSEEIGRRYSADPAEILVFFVDPLMTLKISMPRPRVQGERYERDMHAGQQFVRILDLAIPDLP
jgi:hypothetical protein